MQKKRIIGINDFNGRSALDDPLKVFNFIVEIDGFARLGFMEATGLQKNIAIIEYREGGDNSHVRKSPGLSSFDNLVLKRGKLVRSTEGGDDDIYDWVTEVHDATALGAALEFRRTVDLVLFHRDRTEAARYRIPDTFPARYKPFSDLNATSDEDAIEELELAVETFFKV